MFKYYNMTQKELTTTYIIFKIIFLFISPLIVMVGYNYIGPTISSLFTGKTKEQSENDFVEINFLQSFVLYIIMSILFKTVILQNIC